MSDGRITNPVLQFIQVAQTTLENREAKLRILAKEIEQNMTFVGATGIEDRLQDGVPETIEKLTRAGIKVQRLDLAACAKRVPTPLARSSIKQRGLCVSVGVDVDG